MIEIIKVEWKLLIMNRVYLKERVRELFRKGFIDYYEMVKMFEEIERLKKSECYSYYKEVLGGELYE